MLADERAEEALAEMRAIRVELAAMADVTDLDVIHAAHRRAIARIDRYERAIELS
jgi:hypothetical protein